MPRPRTPSSRLNAPLIRESFCPRLGSLPLFVSDQAVRNLSRFDSLPFSLSLSVCAREDSKPLGILESLSRLPTSSNWLSIVRSNLGIDLVDSPRPPSRRAEQAPSSSPSSREISAQVDEGEANESNRVEVVAVLPAKNQRGRETTLVEAAEGARRIERKWIAHERAI